MGQAWFYPAAGGGLFLNMTALRVRRSTTSSHRVWPSGSSSEPTFSDFGAAGVDAFLFDTRAQRQAELVVRLASPNTLSGTCPPGLDFVGGCADFFGRAVQPAKIDAGAVVLVESPCARHIGVWHLVLAGSVMAVVGAAAGACAYRYYQHTPRRYVSVAETDHGNPVFKD